MASFRRSMLSKKVASDVLELWSGKRLSYAEHVETLSHIGKLVGGRTRGSVGRTAMDCADKKQSALQSDPKFCALVDRCGLPDVPTPSASSQARPADDFPEAKVLSTALLALSSTHEDLAMIHVDMVKEQRDWLLGVIYRVMGAFAHLLYDHRSAPSEKMTVRCVANCLHALNRLHIYDREFLSRSSAFLAEHLLAKEDPPEHSWKHLQQWLHASVELNHPWLPEHYARLIALNWSLDDEATQRIFQLCLNVCCIGADGHRADPFLERCIGEINRRATTKKTVRVSYEKMSSAMLHAAQHCRILVHSEELSAARFEPVVESLIDQQIAEPGRKVATSSRFENQVAQALRELNVEIVERNAHIQPYGLSADFRCRHLGSNVEFFCEIDGPSHFLVVPPLHPRGRLILKKRLFRALKLPLISVPHRMDGQRLGQLSLQSLLQSKLSSLVG